MKRNSAKGILAAQRKQRVWELRQQDHTQQQIADIVGICIQRVSKILGECIADQDRDVLAANATYRKFLRTKVESQSRRLNALLARANPADIPTTLKIEDSLRRNMELLAKITAADKVPAVLVTTPESTGPDLAAVATRVQAWRATLTHTAQPLPPQRGEVKLANE